MLGFTAKVERVASAIEIPISLTRALKISMELNRRACIGNIIMRDVGKFTQSKPGNRFGLSPGGRCRRSFIYVPANCGSLCNANEKQKIANRQCYGFSAPILYLQMGFGMRCAVPGTHLVCRPTSDISASIHAISLLCIDSAQIIERLCIIVH